MKTNSVMRGIAYEKIAAKKHHSTHVGGPGKEDYRRGVIKGEVKATAAKLTKPAIQKIIREKGVTEFVSESGFTKPALAYCNRYRPEVKLIHGCKVVKPRTKHGGA